MSCTGEEVHNETHERLLTSNSSLLALTDIAGSDDVSTSPTNMPSLRTRASDESKCSCTPRRRNDVIAKTKLSWQLVVRSWWLCGQTDRCQNRADVEVVRKWRRESELWWCKSAAHTTCVSVQANCSTCQTTLRKAETQNSINFQTIGKYWRIYEILLNLISPTLVNISSNESEEAT